MELVSRTNFEYPSSTHEYRSVSGSERMRNKSAASSSVTGRRRRRGVLIVKLGEVGMAVND